MSRRREACRQAPHPLIVLRNQVCHELWRDLRRDDLRAIRINPFSAHPHLAFQKLPPDSTAWDRDGSGSLELCSIESKVLVPVLNSKLFVESSQDCRENGAHWTLEKMVPSQDMFLISKLATSWHWEAPFTILRSWGDFSQATSCSFLGSTLWAGDKRNNLSR